MIARKHRFHGYGSLRYVYKNGKIVRGPLCTLKYIRNDRRTSYRAAVVVSKKVSKSAVVRNRIRRRIYETIRETVLPDEPYDIVVMVYSDQLAGCSAAELSKAVAGKLKAAHIILRKPGQTMIMASAGSAGRSDPSAL